MNTNLALKNINEWKKFRGFSNLFNKEIRSWWSTHRWWINLFLWPIILCGLTANILFVTSVADLADLEDIRAAGGAANFVFQMGTMVFFEVGILLQSIGTIIIVQGLILSEKQNGVTECLLAKPIARRSYILAKITANILPIFLFMIGIPSAVTYVLLSMRLGEVFPVVPFLSGVAIMTLHTLFYFLLTMALGTIFNNRGAILGIALGSALGGSLLGGVFPVLFSIMPWTLSKQATALVNSQPIPAEWGLGPIVATSLWCLVFVLIALVRFEKTEF